jgi:tetratricopeptide (TPR) repeat protein
MYGGDRRSAEARIADAGLVAVAAIDADPSGASSPDASLAKVPPADDPLAKVPPADAPPDPDVDLLADVPPDAPAEPPRTTWTRPPTSASFAQAERLVKDADAKARNGLDAMREALALYKQARDLYREQFTLDANPFALFGIAYTAHRLGLFNEARTNAQQLIATSLPEPLGTRAADLLARLEADMVAQGVSLDEIDSTAKPPVASTRAEQAAKLLSQAKQDNREGRYEQSLATFQRAYELDPTAEALFDVCVLQVYLSRCREARRTCQQVVATWPGDPVAKKVPAVLNSYQCR